VCLRRDRARGVEIPGDVGPAGEKDRAQHDATDTVAMPGRIGQRQARPPGTAAYEPAIDGQVLTQPFDVADQRSGVIVRDLAHRLPAAPAPPRWMAGSQKR